MYIYVYVLVYIYIYIYIYIYTRICNLVIMKEGMNRKERKGSSQSIKEQTNTHQYIHTLRRRSVQ